MNVWPLIMSTGNIVLIAFAVTMVIVWSTRPDRMDDVMYYITPLYVVVNFVMSIGFLIQHRYGFTAWCSFWAVVIGWAWWNNKNNRKRRRKLLDRAAGRVVDAGGRLKVARPATSRT